MSLDIYLKGEPRVATCVCPECDHGHDRIEVPSIYSANITHNLNVMADAAGLYWPIWRPEEIGIQVASELIEPLRVGISALKAEPSRFKAMEPKNKWGTYDNFIPWLERLLEACEKNPEAKVEASR